MYFRYFIEFRGFYNKDAFFIYAVDKISWKLLTKPAVFGKDIILACRLPKTCCERYTRKWFGGHRFRLLAMNGVSTIPEKYTEVFNADSRSSKLTIHAFNSSDVNIPYACTYGFETSETKNLNLSDDDFESKSKQNIYLHLKSFQQNSCMYLIKNNNFVYMF